MNGKLMDSSLGLGSVARQLVISITPLQKRRSKALG
jgi:hypothetical protein